MELLPTETQYMPAPKDPSSDNHLFAILAIVIVVLCCCATAGILFIVSIPRFIEQTEKFSPSESITEDLLPPTSYIKSQENLWKNLLTWRTQGCEATYVEEDKIGVVDKERDFGVRPYYILPYKGEFSVVDSPRQVTGEYPSYDIIDHEGNIIRTIFSAKDIAINAYPHEVLYYGYDDQNCKQRVLGFFSMSESGGMISKVLNFLGPDEGKAISVNFDSQNENVFVAVSDGLADSSVELNMVSLRDFMTIEKMNLPSPPLNVDCADNKCELPKIYHELGRFYFFPDSGDSLEARNIVVFDSSGQLTKDSSYLPLIEPDQTISCEEATNQTLETKKYCQYL